MAATNSSSRLIGEVQLLRIRVATAESRLKMLREEAHEAKRRRKEAKRLAQRARKQFKRGQAEAAEFRQSLAEAETRLFKAGGRALARKMAKPRPVAKRGVRRWTQSKAAARKPKPSAR